MTIETTDFMKLFEMQPPKEYQIFDNSTLTIKSNTFQCKDSTIQISNISRVFVKGLPKEKYPAWYFLLIPIGLSLLTIRSFDDIAFVGWLCLLVFALLIYRVYQYNKANQNGLQIEMNSGRISFLVSTDSSFLDEAAEKISNTINEFGRTGSVNNFYELDFQGAQIRGVVAVGSQAGDIHNEQG